MQLIDNDLVEDLNKYVDNVLLADAKYTNIKESNEDKKNSEMIDLNKKIINYRQLNK